MTKLSMGKKDHVNFDDVKAACAILMTADTKISQSNNLHQRLLLTKMKEKSEITMKEFGERAFNCAKINARWKRSRRLISFSSSVDTEERWLMKNTH